MTEREQYQRFKAYMDAPCHELDERDGGRNDPHRLAFAEWGVPKEFLLWMWQAAEKASRRAALDENMRDAARYRAFFDAGLPVCFCGTDYYTKSELDAAIDAVLSPTSP